MRIRVHSAEGQNISIALPTRVLVNSLTATITAKVIDKQAAKKWEREKPLIESREMRRLFRTIHRVKRLYPDLLLVEVESADGSTVKIKL